MESCKGEKLSPYQPSFMIDDLLTRKVIEQNGEFSALSSADKRKENNGERRYSSDYSSQDSKTFTKRESTSTSGTEDDEDGFRKRKKPRTAFSREQVADLEKKFQEKKYLSSAERGELAEKLKLSDMQVKTWFQNRRMKYKRQTEEAEMEMKSPKYPAYPSFVPYGSFYSGYMPMAYKSENMMHYHYQTLRSPPTPSATTDLSNFSPMNLTPPTPFSPLHSPLSRSSSSNPLIHPSASPSTTYFPNTGLFTPLTPPSSSSSSSPSPYFQHPTPPLPQHQSYFTTDTHAHRPLPVTMATNIPSQLQFTAEWPRAVPAPQVP